MTGVRNARQGDSLVVSYSRENARRRTAPPRCRCFSALYAGGFGDLICDFSPAWRCVSPTFMPWSDRPAAQFYAFFCSHRLPVAIAEGFFLLTAAIYDR
ncbi:hypothetical protein KCP70_01185 [Salmonella enterica subsp. enterica]|nr:hypothetical protein KCP70_01185 [Salmonella enterica subsp. enterica]